jgi:polyisoprenoid-binding protein YceI
MKKIAAFCCTAFLLLRPVAGHATPDYYTLDKPNTQIAFSVSNLGFINAKGRFTDYEGGFTYDPAHPQRSRVDVTIMTQSVDMGDIGWNKTLRARDYFNVAEYPTMTFRSTDFHMTGPETADVTGDLTLRGVTQPVIFHMRLNNIGRFMERYVVGLSGDGLLDRSDFGMTAGQPLVGDHVRIHLEVEGDRVPDKLMAAQDGVFGR